MLVKLTFLQKTNMEGDSEDATSQSLLNIEAETSQSLLNTEYDQLIGEGDENSSDSEDYGLGCLVACYAAYQLVSQLPHHPGCTLGCHAACRPEC